MKNFTVHASSVVYYTLKIEAETLEEAYKIAEETSGDAFKEVDLGDWSIDNLVEIT
jgi:uncharacterized protein (UPF0212 family)